MCLNKPLYIYAFQENSISRKKSVEHLINKGTSSFNVHNNTRLLRDTFQNNSREFVVLNEKLNHSILGFFYSLIIEKYPIEYIRKVYSLYLKESLLPVSKKNVSGKLLFFQKAVNIKRIYFLLYNIMFFISNKRKPI
jgi:hypothetical protein